MYYVYVLELSNKDYYAGSTKDLTKRVKKHQNGEVPHTSKFRPLKLVWYSAFNSKEKAVGFEDYLKTGSGKAFRNKRFI
jgi:predicted GIY-YIG superfamily endonuclease